MYKKVIASPKLFTIKSTKYMTISLADINENFYDIKSSQCGVWVLWLNSKRAPTPLPLDKLERYLGKSKASQDRYVLIIPQDWRKRIPAPKDIHLAARLANRWRIKTENNEALPKIEKMSLPERLDLVKFHFKQLTEAFAPAQKLDAARADRVLDAVTICYLTLKVSILQFARGEQDQVKEKQMYELAFQTELMTEKVIKSLAEDRDIRMLIERMEKSARGITMDHINRVFINYGLLLIYYNNLFNTKSFAIELSNNFDNKYRDFYAFFFQNRYVTLNDVFWDRKDTTTVKYGVRKLTEQEIINGTLGALLHDIGKTANRDYHESTTGYDQEEIEKHAHIGYKMLRNITRLPPEVALMAGEHHGLYRQPPGYGVFSTRYSKNRPGQVLESCMSYEHGPVAKGRVLATFQTKFLELIDIYDALTDKARGYRERPYTPEEALILMKREFLDEFKIDKILFDIFQDFIRDYPELIKGRR